MSLAFWFWLIFVLCVLCIARPWWDARPTYWVFGGWFWLWVLVAILGYRDFGTPWAALIH